jgi:predicted transcriptional regulator
MSDHDAELDEIVAMLESAGLLIETTEDGKPALQLTAKGAQVATQMAMGHENDAAALLDALLEGGPSGP